MSKLCYNKVLTTDKSHLVTFVTV